MSQSPDVTSLERALPAILPKGTSIVTTIDLPSKPAGSVGTLIRIPSDPEHTYGVRFLDGHEKNLKRNLFRVRRHHKNDLPDEEHDLTGHIQLKVVVGSRAFGLHGEDSDTDLRGFYLPPTALSFGLRELPEQLQEGEETYWEARKFVLLALKANPNVLEVLHSPMILHVTPLAQELLDQRSVFLSRLVYQTYAGYVLGQFKRMETDLRQHGEVKWKHVMHLLRLLMSGTHLLRTGEMMVDVSHKREDLLAIKRGEWAWEQTEAWRMTLHREFEDAFKVTQLPERPDYQRTEDWLIHARHHALGERP